MLDNASECVPCGEERDDDDDDDDDNDDDNDDDPKIPKLKKKYLQTGPGKPLQGA